jgi:hypothetical protein
MAHQKARRPVSRSLGDEPHDLVSLERHAAIAASLAPQHGCPLETLRRVLRDAHGNASTPLGRALDIIAEREGGR